MTFATHTSVIVASIRASATDVTFAAHPDVFVTPMRAQGTDVTFAAHIDVFVTPSPAARIDVTFPAGPHPLATRSSATARPRGPENVDAWQLVSIASTLTTAWVVNVDPSCPGVDPSTRSRPARAAARPATAPAEPPARSQDPPPGRPTHPEPPRRPAVDSRPPPTPPRTLRPIAPSPQELPPGPPASLWDRLREDPARAPEHLALAAAERHAPAAEAWIAERRGQYDLDPRELAAMAKRRHAAYARFSGAATGVGGVVTMVPDLVSLMWIQSRLVFFVAAAFGYDPRDRMRPAELLVLRDLYPTPAEARAALDGVGRSVAMAYVGSKMDRDRALATRLLGMAGRRTAARLIPGLAIGVNAIQNERDTRRLADRAIAFYGG